MTTARVGTASTLDFGGRAIGDQAAIFLAKELSSNATITSLNLGRTSLGSECGANMGFVTPGAKCCWPAWKQISFIEGKCPVS